VRTNRSIPAVTVIPVLICPDAREAVASLSAAFGFDERLRIGENHRAQLRFGDDGALIVADVRGDPEVPETTGNLRTMSGRLHSAAASQLPGRPVFRRAGRNFHSMSPLALHTPAGRAGKDACVTLEWSCTQSFGLCRVEVESPVGALVEGLLECLAGGEPEDEWRFGGECALNVGCGL
jgi:hypothetical protein